MDPIKGFFGLLERQNKKNAYSDTNVFRNLCIFAAVASLLPYLAVYMKQLGLSPSETALIYGTMPFLGAIVRPLVGALADKLHAHKVRPKT